ncbi:MAG: stage III sporulation protein AE [Bacillaceae bacterium]|jgi:stage III sporulation protein AE|uniref:Stage III sporulation protein AE n=1 Tax=Aeribacillus pallidus TaxID=33936 RepID=A0A223E9C9_9BACI|nr:MULTISPECIES: stage III sporulation protein AE [Aeribacillus]AXI40110.1 stage III sporulation protein AE [Bacillaceae bacterium ZC4]REJ18539.1 MAG: stage III sporulation protein AE [Bacillaceae bacterium]ASS91867.1 stage III sporulation protein AE [Aeribacillus pallidus]MED1438285.1 stage III sporulation protein AE [Aeribacillus composti]MED1442126.1 stage III sporulation protein AE [Aeribacillus composti]
MGIQSSFFRGILFLAFFAFAVPNMVQASQEQNSSADPPKEEAIQQEYMAEQMDELGIEEIKNFWNDIMTTYGGLLPESQKGSLMDFIKGEKQFSIKEWAVGILKFLLHEILANGKLLGTIIILTIFSVLLQHLQNAFEEKNVSKVAYSIVYMVLVILALNSFHVAISYATNAINGMTSFLLALIPMLIALMASSGGVASAAFFHPITIFLMNGSGLLIEKIVLPLLFLSSLLFLISTMTDQYKVTQLAQLFRSISIWLLGIFLTIFLGVISVQGATAAVTDGIALRTTKFITGNFIPVLGKMFTEAADTLFSASMLLKNTIGVIGVAILFLITIFPAMKVLAIAFIYKFAAAVLQPLGPGEIISCLDIISKSIIYILAALILVSFMFFLSITVIIAASNVTMMVR